MGRYRLQIVIILALVGGTVWLFAHACDNGFVNYDDPQYVTENPHVRDGLTGPGVWWALTTTHASNWHPLTWLSLQLDAEVQGPYSWGYHLTNVLLHGANAGLLFWVLWRMTGALGRSAVVAALFAAHPLHVESVAWVTERKDVLSTLFWMLTLWAYVRYVERPSWGRYLLVVQAFTLGLLAKPMLVTLPFALLLLDYWPLRRCARTALRPLVWEKLPLFALAGASCAVTLFAQHGQAMSSFEDFSLPVRLGSALVAYVAYIRKTLWPMDLAVFYPHPGDHLSGWEVAAAGILLAAVSVLVWKLAGRFPYLAVGWLWYLGTLVPVIGLVQVGLQNMADRYTYVPLIGLFLLATWGIADFVTRQRLQTVAAAATTLLLLVCVLWSWLQVHYWRDSFTLWEHALAVTTDNYVAHHNLGTALEKEGQLEDAVRHYAEAIRINPDYVMTHYNMAGTLQDLGRIPEAEQEYLKTLRLDPGNPLAHYNYGLLLTRDGRLEEAIRHYREAVRLEPGHALFCYRLGQALVYQGQTEEAVAYSRQAVTLQPGIAPFQCNLAWALFKEGKAEAGAAFYRQALRLDPHWPQTAWRGAWAMATHPDARARNGKIALALAEQICQATENQDPAFLDTLAAAYAEEGQFEQAQRTAETALALASSRGQAALADAIVRRLQLYRNHQPFRASEVPRETPTE